ncbi:amidase [Dinghuibacter silviterrae]|uniref:Amidase n=1 Tax=Dinghuibacter silviterrae TaxID=1539049 RepID=A0A4R8DVH6_9BACT|nr:amidase [Dinghuibacter silviterrae]TDX01417.1 amidase [Dinghuibacter silviterrae]
MLRRSFLKTGSLAGVSALALAGCQPSSTGHKNADTTATGAAVVPPFDLDESTIDGLQQKMQQGTHTARSLTEAYLKRIAAVDPLLRAVIELNPDALSIADDLDKERKNGKVRGPLHGIPVLIKDNIDSGDKMMTTAGALAMEGNIATQDAFIVGKLREAGAVLLGKTNLSEWANFRSERSTSGWSSRGGQTHCPFILDRNPSGSSAGTGSAVSANLCVIGIGTETNGSIVSPSSVNGLVGIKPTVGLWSRSGIIPISATQDTAGPMARTVRDAAVLLGALTGVDPRDPATGTGKGLKDYTVFLTGKGLKGKRIGIERSFLHGHEGVVALYNKAIDLLKQQGAEVVEVDLLKALEPIGHAEFTVLQYEFKDGVNRYLAQAPHAKPRSLTDVIAFNRANVAKAMPFFQQETLESSDKKGGLDSTEYKEALAKVLGSRKTIDDLMHTQRLDAIAGVTNGLACCIDLITGDYDTGFSFSGPAAMAGYPHITVPMGTVMGLPVGFSFMGSAYQEPVLLDMAYSFEQARPKRAVPGFAKAFIP